MKLSRLLCLVLALGAVDASAQTRLFCQEFDASSNSIFRSRGCAIPSMPSYNQSSLVIANGWFPKNADGTPNRNKSNLCLPTSGAMVSAAITDAGLRIVPGSFTDTQIRQAPNWWSRIHAFADLWGTIPELGTEDSQTTMSSRSVDVVNATGYVRGSGSKFTNTMVLSAIDSGVSMLMDYGKYAKVCTTFLLVGKTCVYAWISGHAVALQGAYNGQSSSYVIVFDPAGPVANRQAGWVRYRSLRPVSVEPGVVQDLMPYSNSTYVSTDVSNSFTTPTAGSAADASCLTCGIYPIVDWLSGIQTR